MNTVNSLQRTLKQSVSFVGLGLHSGVKSRITLKPCEDASGIFFKRMDVPERQALIAARWYKISDTTLSTALTNQYGVSVSTVEHLMAALRICGIDNLIVELDGPEIPIMDGSAKPFVDTLMKIGTRSLNAVKKAIWVHKTIKVQKGSQYALLLPGIQSKITVSIDFEQEVIGAQTLSVNMKDKSLQKEIAPARTFGFKDQITGLHEQGLALGGSLKNAILVDGHHIVNPEGLRFKDEFVRHKLLDTIGDLSLLGVPILGHYHSFKGGHLLNKLLLNKLIMDKSSWSYISMDEFYQLYDDEAMIENEFFENENTYVINQKSNSA